ncbi:hypothetical protein P4O66_017895, partial [Electrophorus voltai]
MAYRRIGQALGADRGRGAPEVLYIYRKLSMQETKYSTIEECVMIKWLVLTFSGKANKAGGAAGYRVCPVLTFSRALAEMTALHWEHHNPIRQ